MIDLSLNLKMEEFLNCVKKYNLSRTEILFLLYALSETEDFKEGFSLNQYIISVDTGACISSVRKCIQSLHSKKLLCIKKCFTTSQNTNIYLLAERIMKWVSNG